MTEGESARNIADTSGPVGRQRVFIVRGPAVTVFPKLCGLLPLALVAPWFLPHLPGPLIVLLVASVVVFLFADLLIRLNPLFGRIAVDDEGLTLRKHSVRWDQVVELRKSWWRAGPFVLVVQGPKRRRLGLPPSPVVLREVLPAVLEHRPDITVSPRARRAMADPQAALTPPRWLAIWLLALAVILGAAPLAARAMNLSGLMVSLACLAAILLDVGSASLYSTEGSFVAPLMTFPMMLLFLLGALVSIPVPVYVPTMAAAAMAAMCLAGAGVVGLRIALGFWRKVAILLVAGAVSLGVYLAGSAGAVPRKDITHLLADGQPLGDFRWSEDGSLLVDSWAEGPRAVDLSSMKPRPLPRHERGAFLLCIWPGGAVYRVGGERPEVRLYRFSDRREVRLGYCSKGFGLPVRLVSPDGRRVAWLEAASGDHGRELRVFDIAEERTETVKAAWPEEASIRRSEVAWVDDRTLALAGRKYLNEGAQDPGPSFLRALRVMVSDGGTRHWASPEAFATWSPAPDLAGAFACGKEADERDGIEYVDLAGRRTVALGGHEIPRWQPDGRAAWRVVDSGPKGQWLCRFDREKATETPVLKLAPAEELGEVSPTGRHAVLRLRGVRLWPLKIVDVATGRGQRLPVSIIGSFGAWSLFGSWRFPSKSCWCPDGRRFVLLDFSMKEPHWRVFLYQLPAE